MVTVFTLVIACCFLFSINTVLTLLHAQISINSSPLIGEASRGRQDHTISSTEVSNKKSLEETHDSKAKA